MTFKTNRRNRKQSSFEELRSQVTSVRSREALRELHLRGTKKLMVNGKLVDLDRMFPKDLDADQMIERAERRVE